MNAFKPDSMIKSKTKAIRKNKLAKAEYFRALATRSVDLNASKPPSSLLFHCWINAATSVGATNSPEMVGEHHY